MVSNRIFISIIVIIFIISSNLIICCKDNNHIINNSQAENNCFTIIEGLKNNYVLDITHSIYGNHVEEVKDEIKRLNKTYSDYQIDSAKFYQAIIDIYKSDTILIKYLLAFKQDTSYRNITLFFFNPENRSYNSFIQEEWTYQLYFYRRMNNIALTLILNYYLNTEQQTIKLYLDAVYVDKKSKITEKMYKKLDKIFDKYGYEDKEKIRQAILNDFGKCIDYTQLPSE